MKNSLKKISFFGQSIQIEKPILLVFINLFWLSGIAQNSQDVSSGNLINETTQVSVEKKVFNLPPGVVLLPKADTNIDYSYKLNQIPHTEPKNMEVMDFFKDIPKEKLDYMEQKSLKDFQYYVTAKEYYNKLSNKVKVTFTIEELWYIYYFDQKLKNTLLGIK